MNPVDAVRTCLTKYADFSGRAGRPEFWWFFLFEVIVTVVTYPLPDIIGLLAGLALLVPALAVGARRLHDTGKSGWLQLILLLPLVGFIILVVLWAKEGDRTPNQHGAPVEPQLA